MKTTQLFLFLCFAMSGSFARAESGFWPGLERRGVEFVDGISLMPVSAASCALDAPAERPDLQRIVQNLRDREINEVEALQFQNPLFTMFSQNTLAVSMSTLLLRCNRGGRQANARYHWQAFVPSATEALVLWPKSGLKNDHQSAPYRVAQDPRMGARGTLVLKLDEQLNSNTRKLLERGEVVQIKFALHHGVTRASRDLYQREQLLPMFFSNYSVLTQHLLVTVTLRMNAAGTISIIRKRADYLN